MLQALKKEHPTPILGSAGRPAAVKSTIGLKSDLHHTAQQEDHTRKEAVKKVDSSIRNAFKSRSVESRLEATSSVQPMQRQIEEHEPLHGKRGVPRDV